MRCRAQEIYDSIFHRGNLIGLVAGQQRQYYEPVYLPTKSHEATAAGRKDHTIRKALLYEPWLCSLGECLGAGVDHPRAFALRPAVYTMFSWQLWVKHNCQPKNFAHSLPGMYLLSGNIIGSSIWQKTTKVCKAIILQLKKINKIRKKSIIIKDKTIYFKDENKILSTCGYSITSVMSDSLRAHGL